jgi:cobalt-zinc-cadmium efflux system outer membrane protein
MRGRTARAAGGALGLLGLAGCATVDLGAGFDQVQAVVRERAGAHVAWQRGAEPDDAVAARLRALLGRPLAAEDAVQVALLASRELQAVYAELGLAQADLVQAGLVRNPVLDAAVLVPLAGGRPDIELGVAMGLLDALYVPLRRRVAAARFEEAKLRVSGAVLDVATRVRAAFYRYQADEQLLELRRTVVEALGAGLEVSRRLHAAGNLSDLDLARERVQAEGARLQLRAAETAARQGRERLNGLMGLWGADTGWRAVARLPELPAEPDAGEPLERLAVARSLDLAEARLRILGAGEQLGLARWTGLLPDLDAGLGAEREGGEGWELGPRVSLPLPVFDQGQARVARAVAELRRARHAYHALAVRIRATARAVQDRLAEARDRARFHREVLLPLHERIVGEAQLHYNAMQLGIGQLLRDRQQQVEAGVAYVEALRDYWLARADQAALAAGRLPDAAAPPAGAARAGGAPGANGH